MTRSQGEKETKRTKKATRGGHIKANLQGVSSNWAPTKKRHNTGKTLTT